LQLRGGKRFTRQEFCCALGFASQRQKIPCRMQREQRIVRASEELPSDPDWRA